MRLALLVVVAVVLMSVSFALWGDRLESALGSAEALERYRALGAAGALLLVGLLVADVLLPVPTTPLLTASGALYGALLGALVGATGSVGAGAAAYGLARALGPRGARWLLGDRDLTRLEGFFRSGGAWAIAASRWLPILPELLAALAGLGRMPPGRFFAALALGSVPMAAAFAALGAGLADRPILATLIAAIVPAALWPIVQALLGRHRDGPGGPTGDGPSRYTPACTPSPRDHKP